MQFLSQTTQPWAIYTVTRPVPHPTQHGQGQRCCMYICHLTKLQSEIGYHYHSKSATWQNLSQELDTMTTPSLPSDKTSVKNWTPLPLPSLPSDKTSVRNRAPLQLQVCHLTKPQSEIDTIIRPTPSLPSDKTSARNWTPLSDQLQACHLTKPQSEVGHHCHFHHLILKHNIHTY